MESSVASTSSGRHVSVSSVSKHLSAPSSTKSASSSEEPMYKVKLLSALRNGDPASILPFLAEIGKDKGKTVDSNLDTSASVLHLAIRCASEHTITLLLSHRAISPNGVHPPGSGTTPLHLAASLGRIDVVSLLLEQDGIDDSKLDANGKSCVDVAKNKQVRRVIDDSRAYLNAYYRSILRSYILSSADTPPTALISLLESPRSTFVDLSYLDDSGQSLLHEAARRNDLRLIETAIRAGADVFVRNRQGKMPQDIPGKDDRARAYLRQYANQDTSLVQGPVPLADPPVMKGYLNKFVNVARGYQPRWFVLEHGVLSYFRHQEDETVASRGSIAMKTAILRTTATDKHKFDVWSTPSKGHTSGVQKWYLKANHPMEASRWTQAMTKSIEWHRREQVQETQEDRQSIESQKSAVSKAFGTVKLPSIRSNSSRNPHKANSIGHSSLGGQASEVESFVSKVRFGAKRDEEEEDDSSTDQSLKKTVPFQSTIDLHTTSIAAQLDLTAQLIADVGSQDDAAKAKSLHTALTQSFSAVQAMFTEYAQMTKTREDWYSKTLQKEREKSTMWEESFTTVVREGEGLENELRARSRKRGSRVFDPDAHDGTVKLRRSALFLVPPDFQSVAEESSASSIQIFTDTPISVEPAPSPPDAKPPSMAPRSDTQTTVTQQTAVAQPPPDDDFDTDDEDEFFDAIEANAIPNLVIPEPLKSPSHTEPHIPADAMDLTLPYEGYKELRDHLDLTDERPNQSLWAVLKNSIGKDLTKISFPVSFNEPTSMLQRMAEDMEFSECLDVAASTKDPLLRVAYVAAFAMSNYSSTIGRIAKPFNPMLSETFEYVQLDKEYRYISEQVSHHPPISACYAESPLWHYYGEVDAQNKFMGKSFEIRPTGVAHADLALPEDWAPNYPKAKGRSQQGKVIEHYSWKKVTTNISGFIMGSPTIDHYGDMKVVNHRTGDRCILTFKPRGWRGRDAFEISGVVLDARGRVRYDIAGRWNSQLIAREVGVGSGTLLPDALASGPNSPSTSQHLLLWRNSEKPAGAPFNLTPFAMTLNHCPKEKLKPYLCPTDCRLRVDQRAFEMGKYDLANTLKQEQEEKQRAIRKARETGEMGPHKPRWFRAETDGDSGERVWAPKRTGDTSELEYWKEKERVWAEKTKGNAAKDDVQWKDVDNIFIEEPDFMK